MTEGLPATGAEPWVAAPDFLSAPSPVQHAAPLRIVFDTNVLLSLYVFADSRFAPLRHKLDSGAWQAFSSTDCLAEFHRVLNYPQFGLAAETQEAAFAAYAACVSLSSREAAALRPPVISLPRCTDRDDQKFLEAARDNSADWLLTSDKALLRLARRECLAGLFRVLTPEAALLAL